MVSGPICALVSVVEVTAMSVGDVKAASDELCHLTTVPVWPVSVISAGAFPVQID